MFDPVTGYDIVTQCVPIDNGTPYVLKIKFYSNDTQREWRAPDGDVYFRQAANTFQQYSMNNCIRGETLCYVATEERPGGASYGGSVACGARALPACIRNPTQVPSPVISTDDAAGLGRYNSNMTNSTIELMRTWSR